MQPGQVDRGPVRTRHLLIALSIFIAEIGVGFSTIRFVRGFVSDFLVVILIFHLVKAFVNVPRAALALGVLAFAVAVEVSQYFHLADLLGFARGGLPGILLGNSFSWYDILMYILGCATAFLLDAFGVSKSRAI